jgi:hypothetical protein
VNETSQYKRSTYRIQSRLFPSLLSAEFNRKISVLCCLINKKNCLRKKKRKGLYIPSPFPPALDLIFELLFEKSSPLHPPKIRQVLVVLVDGGRRAPGSGRMGVRLLLEAVTVIKKAL